MPTDELLADEYLAERAALIGERAGTPGPGAPDKGGTVYLCTADRDGMMVSFIQSNYLGFGSGVVVPGLGIALQNRAAGFVLDPSHPNVAAPGKRPRHTIIPGFLTRQGEALGPFGVMGAEMQPQGHVQIVSALVDQGLNPQAALDQPRWQVHRWAAGVGGAGHAPRIGERVTGAGSRDRGGAGQPELRPRANHPAAR